MWNAAEVAQQLYKGYAKDYGFQLMTESPPHDWSRLKSGRDKFIREINEGYQEYLQSIGIQFVKGHGKLGIPIKREDGSSLQTVMVSKNDSSSSVQEFHGKHVVLATGGGPEKLKVPGGHLSLNSDDFFAMDNLPARCAVIGAGYIAVELAGVLNSLGSEVHWFIRYDRPLRTFDHSISECLVKSMEHSGIKLYRNSLTVSIVEEGGGNKLTLQYTQGTDKRVESLVGLDAVIGAIGRVPKTDNLGLEEAGVKTNAGTNLIVTDAMQNTTAPNIYAIGDVCGPLFLTPGKLIY